MTSHRRTLAGRLTVLGVMLSGLGLSARAAVFYGIDPNAGPGAPRPVSDATAGSFDAAAAALGTASILDFEGIATGVYNGGFSPTAGVNISFVNQDNGARVDTISNTQSSTTGYNTTAGGSHALKVTSLDQTTDNLAIFDFTTPIQAFGAYFTGMGNVSTGGIGTVTVEYNDGIAQTQPLTGFDGPNVFFFGITDPGRSFSRVTFRTTPVAGTNNDAYGIDDFRYVAAGSGAIPEPGSLVLLVAGLPTVGLIMRRRRRT